MYQWSPLNEIAFHKAELHAEAPRIRREIGAHAIQFKVRAVHRLRMAKDFSRGCFCSSEGAKAAHPFAFGSTL